MTLHEWEGPMGCNGPGGGSPQAGLGRCSLCGCPSFEGDGNYCEDCGHAYDDHNTAWLGARDTGQRLQLRSARNGGCRLPLLPLIRQELGLAERRSTRS